MSVNSSGLASLTATYTDSEGEDELKDEEQEESPSSVKPDEVVVNPSSSKQHTRRLAQLVSYNDDTVVSDDEGVADAEAYTKENDVSVVLSQPEKGKEEAVIAVEEEEVIEEEDENDVKLPPEPSGKCSSELQEKISHLHKKMKSSAGLDMNEVIQKRKAFRNPSIYEKLIQFCGINELGTNYPPHIYDPELWGKESYYEELAKVQKAEMDKREKERKEKTKVEFVSGTAKKLSNWTSALEDDKKRKSKWDQVGGLASGTISAPSLLRPVGLTQPPALNTSSTGAKGTVISAFGSLPKKPRV